MQVSVIIPVYNAEKYVRQAVESAIAQPETGEVILVEDGSHDHAIQVCRELEKEYSNVRLFQHPNGENRGAGASRNLGIEKAKCNFIAFLDADDYYLPNRFTVPKELFLQDSSIDGVYEAVGTDLDNELGQQRWSAINGSTITTVKEKVSAEALFETLLSGKGWFHTNGVVVRKSIFDKTGYFDKNLKLKQDTAMWVKMSAVGMLVPGRLNNPVAMRRVHGNNRIFSCDETVQYYRYMLWKTLFYWGIENNLVRFRIEAIFNCYVFLMLNQKARKKNLFSRKISQLLEIVKIGISYPMAWRFNKFFEALFLILGLRIKS